MNGIVPTPCIPLQAVDKSVDKFVDKWTKIFIGLFWFCSFYSIWTKLTKQLWTECKEFCLVLSSLQKLPKTCQNCQNLSHLHQLTKLVQICLGLSITYTICSILTKYTNLSSFCQLFSNLWITFKNHQNKYRTHISKSLILLCQVKKL